MVWAERVIRAGISRSADDHRQRLVAQILTTQKIDLRTEAHEPLSVRVGQGATQVMKVLDGAASRFNTGSVGLLGDSFGLRPCAERRER